MILLVTCFPWDSGQGGPAIVRHLVNRLDAEPIRWFAMSKPAEQVPFDARHVTFEFHAPPARGNVRLRLGKFWRWYQRRVWSTQMAALLSRRIADLNPRVVWLMADYGLAPVGLRVMRVLRDRRLHISVHDDLVPAAQREGASSNFLREVREFLNGLREMDLSADAVSEELLATTLPGASRSAIVTLPVNPTKCVKEFTEPRRTGPLIIGFSGNFFGEAEFAIFVAGLRLWSQHCGRDWRLLVFGASRLGALDARIVARGFTPVDEVRAALANCDLLLLPSPLDRPEMRTNMPTKLVSYLELGRMIFAFAPEKSSTCRVISDANLGPVLSSRNAATVEAALNDLQNWNVAGAATGWRRLVEYRFNEERIVQDMGAAMAG